MRTSSILFFLLAVVFPTALPAQNDLVYIKSDRLKGGMYNILYTAGCKDSVRIQEVFVETIDHYLDPGLPREILEVKFVQSGVYRIIPATYSGVYVVTDYQGELDTVKFRTKPLVPTVYFGGNNWRKDSMPVIVAKAQQGIYAQLDNYDIDARIPINDFTITLVNQQGFQTVANTGGYFDTAARALIDQLSPGDILLFRRVTYRYFGESEPIQAQDLVITVY